MAAAYSVVDTRVHRSGLITTRPNQLAEAGISIKSRTRDSGSLRDIRHAERGANLLEVAKSLANALAAILEICRLSTPCAYGAIVAWSCHR